jgi:hypothetical protein
MNVRRNKTVALVLAAALPLSACTTTHLAGDYHPRGTGTSEGTASDVYKSGKESVEGVGRANEQKPVIATGHSFTFLWGTLNTGSVQVDVMLSPSFKDKTIRGVEVEDRISLGGVVLWILTAGIFSHHSVIVRGDIAPETPPPSTTPSSSPSTPAPPPPSK